MMSYKQKILISHNIAEYSFVFLFSFPLDLSALSRSQRSPRHRERRKTKRQLRDCGDLGCRRRRRLSHPHYLSRQTEVDTKVLQTGKTKERTTRRGGGENQRGKRETGACATTRTRNDHGLIYTYSTRDRKGS